MFGKTVYKYEHTSEWDEIYISYTSTGVYLDNSADIYHVFKFPKNDNGIKFGMNKKELVSILGKPYYMGDNYISYRLKHFENVEEYYESHYFIFLNDKLFAFKEFTHQSN